MLPGATLLCGDTKARRRLYGVARRRALAELSPVPTAGRERKLDVLLRDGVRLSVAKTATVREMDKLRQR
jgi:hypothetical protein